MCGVCGVCVCVCVCVYARKSAVEQVKKQRRSWSRRDYLT